MSKNQRKVMLINVTHAEESRVAILHDGVLESFEIETFDHKSLKGNIYKGKIESVHPGLQAAFVDIGQRKAAFLPLDELNFVVHPVRAEQQKGRIENHIQKGQEVLVQVVRDAYGTKPPTVSTYFSLPGRYLVLTPHADAMGISRKLEDKQRTRVREILDALPRPDEHGVIVRTAGGAATKTDLQRDLKYLIRLWERIESANKKIRAPKLIYQERSLVIRAVRDLFTPDVDELLVDDQATYQEILEFFDTVAPTKKKIVKLYEGERPIFNKHNLEEQIENIFRRRVPLPSGGALVFDTTEALTAVDVNSSKMRKEGHIEDTALKANVEAAEEIARQLRLRDMGGLVVVDFIDMRSKKNIREVEKTMRDAMKKDKARYDVTRISQLGLMEISRERLAAEKSSLRYADCPHCIGTGKIKTIEAAAIQALRKLQTRVVRGDLERIELVVPIEVAEYLLNQKRDDLVTWEERYQTNIHVKGSGSLGRDDANVSTIVRDKSLDLRPAVAPPTHGEVLAGLAEDEAREKAAAEAAAAASAEGGSGEAASDEGDATKKKRRRRRRRKKPAAANGEPDASAANGDDAADGADSGEVAEEPAAEGSGAEDGAVVAAENGNGEASSKKRRRRRRRRKKPTDGEGAAAESTNGGAPAQAEASRDEVSAVHAPPLAIRAVPEDEQLPNGRNPRPRWWRALVGDTGKHVEEGAESREEEGETQPV